ncbi:MAG: NAD(P)/FAD-dependent oxidoreductase [Deltaproteobacteria bacterium]|nr:NAD(P)/FAD-dependent oxidoreductase [Deltaproteobacteria bacterium]
MSDWDAIVVGAGYGGVTAAAVLASAGRRVLLLDKNDRAGGKALTVDRDGTRYDLWPIAGGPARGSRFAELCSLIGLGETTLLTPDAACELVHIGLDGRPRSFRVPARPVWDPRRIAAMFGRLGVPRASLGGLAALILRTAVAPGWPEDLDQVPMLELLERYRLPSPVLSTLAALCNLLFVVPVDRLPASEALSTLRDFGRGGAGRYHAGGFGSIAQAAASFVEARGGTFLRGARVSRILVEGGRAAGVAGPAGEHRARVVLSNAGIQPTVLRLVGEERFTSAYVARVRSLEPSWAFVGVRLHLDRPIFEVPMTVVYSDESWLDQRRYDRAAAGSFPRDPLLFITVPSLFDPSLAPRGSQVALLGTLGSPDPGSPMNDEAIRRAQDAATRLWPALRDHVVRREAFSARHVSSASRDQVVPRQGGECIGIGQLIGQCGRSKPRARSPLPGLYFVGCDAGGYGCGTHQAVDSGFRVAAMVLGDSQ